MSTDHDSSDSDTDDSDSESSQSSKSSAMSESEDIGSEVSADSLRAIYTLSAFLNPRQNEHELLGHDVEGHASSQDHEVRTAPVITRQAYLKAGGADVFPQRGLLGSVIANTE